MGSVYKAIDLFLKMPVALKVIDPAIARDELAVQRLKHEVVLARKFTHPNACRIYDIGEANGSVYVSMELIQGETLSSVLARRGKLPLQEIIKIMQDVLRALVEAHRAGVIHRDLKPQNIMISDSKAYLMDFGISISEDMDRLTRTGMLVGTPHYMAPEQFLEGKADERSDIYSLGVILFEMGTGRLPFEANTPSALMYSHVSKPVQAPSVFAKELPLQFDQIVLKALSKDPKTRFDSANKLLATLVRLYALDVHAQVNQSVQSEPQRPITAPIRNTTAPMPEPTPKPPVFNIQGSKTEDYEQDDHGTTSSPPLSFAILNVFSGLSWILVCLMFRAYTTSAGSNAQGFYIPAGFAFLVAFMHLMGTFGGRFRSLALKVAAIMLLPVFPFGTAQAFALSSYEYGKKHAGRGLLLMLMTVFTIGISIETLSLALAIEPPIYTHYYKITMADMRAIATAVENYAVDNNEYPPVRSVQELIPFIQPKYIKVTPLRDAWDSDFVYISDSQSYTICSKGKDKEGCDRFDYKGPILNYENDIVFSSGEFVTYPEGAVH